MVAVAALAKFVMDCLPLGLVRALFMTPAAWAASSYWGVPLEMEPLSFTAHGVTLEVVRACAATDFFSIVFALLACSLPVRSASLRVAVALPAAWFVAVVANSIRLVLLIVADGLFGGTNVPIVHMAVGLAVFLSTFGVLWYFLHVHIRKETDNDKPEHT